MAKILSAASQVEGLRHFEEILAEALPKGVGVERGKSLDREA